MITPINSYGSKAFAGDVTQPSEKCATKSKYTDPLSKWPVRGMAFSNDVGTAIIDISPKLGTALWIPALMYFGADIYDKYRNDKDSYNPSARRGLKQAAFQTLASILFPIVAVHAGQKTFSLAARAGKDGISLQTKEEIIRHHLDYMSHRRFKDFTPQEYKEQYGKALDNYLDETIRADRAKSPFKKVMNLIFGGKHSQELSKARRLKVHEYINNRIDNMFEYRQELLENKKPDRVSPKLFTEFQALKSKYKADPNHVNDFADKAAKDTLKALENNKILKIKMIKTLGGFVSLGLFIKPIDKFVKNVIIDKYVSPSLDKFDKAQLEHFKEKMAKD